MFYIYKISCSQSDKIYIGKSTVPIEQRQNRHVKEAYKTLDTHLSRAIRLYGPEAFSIEVIDTCEENHELLKAREKYWIAFYSAYDYGYNETKGGEGGNTYSKKSLEEMKEIKEKLRESKLGRKNPNAKQIKCKNFKTNEEFTFGSLSECRDFLKETNHQFISRRLNGSTKTLWKETWGFAYYNEDYPSYYTTQKNNKSVQISVIDLLENTEPKIFMSFSAAERFYNQPQRSFSLSRQKNKKQKTYIVKNRYKITILE